MGVCFEVVCQPRIFCHYVMDNKVFWILNPESVLGFIQSNISDVEVCRLVLRLSAPSQTHWPVSQQHCFPNTNRTKPNYNVNETCLEHWKEETKSRCECYLALERDDELAEYLSTVRDRKQRQILTRFRLSDHKLETEKGRLKKS